MPASPAAVAPAISPSVCMRRVKPVGAMPKGSSPRSPEHVAAEVDLGDVAQDRRVQLDVAERLSGAGQGELVLGGAVGVVEGGARGRAFGDRGAGPRW